jgi:hypothetical protein
VRGIDNDRGVVNSNYGVQGVDVNAEGFERSNDGIARDHDGIMENRGIGMDYGIQKKEGVLFNEGGKGGILKNNRVEDVADNGGVVNIDLAMGIERVVEIVAAKKQQEEERKKCFEKCHK